MSLPRAPYAKYLLKALQKAKMCKCVPRVYHIVPLVPVMDWTLGILSMTSVPRCPRFCQSHMDQYPWQIRKFERRLYCLPRCYLIQFCILECSGSVPCWNCYLQILESDFT